MEKVSAHLRNKEGDDLKKKYYRVKSHYRKAGRKRIKIKSYLRKRGNKK